ncbi:hypothetical protein N431DRAFT_429300 [Stipitochalara longipes BDJ]|nr:hypothetical protein N431DRAFT_429300 [Stipitochalara longipes BDJ]
MSGAAAARPGQPAAYMITPRESANTFSTSIPITSFYRKRESSMKYSTPFNPLINRSIGFMPPMSTEGMMLSNLHKSQHTSSQPKKETPTKHHDDTHKTSPYGPYHMHNFFGTSDLTADTHAQNYYEEDEGSILDDNILEPSNMDTELEMSSPIAHASNPSHKINSGIFSPPRRSKYSPDPIEELLDASHTESSADHGRQSMLKARTNNLCVSYTISEDMSGDRRKRILSRIGEKKRDSGGVNLKIISSYTDRLGLKDRRSVSTRNVEERVEENGSESESSEVPLSRKRRHSSNRHGRIMLGMHDEAETTYPSNPKNSTRPVGKWKRPKDTTSKDGLDNFSGLGSVPTSSIITTRYMIKTPELDSDPATSDILKSASLPSNRGKPAYVDDFDETGRVVKKNVRMARNIGHQSSSTPSLPSQEMKRRARRESPGGEVERTPPKRLKAQTDLEDLRDMAPAVVSYIHPDRPYPDRPYPDRPYPDRSKALSRLSFSSSPGDQRYKSLEAERQLYPKIEKRNPRNLKASHVTQRPIQSFFTNAPPRPSPQRSDYNFVTDGRYS